MAHKVTKLHNRDTAAPCGIIIHEEPSDILPVSQGSASAQNEKEGRRQDERSRATGYLRSTETPTPQLIAE